MDKEQLKKYIYDYVKEYKEIPIYQLEDLFKEMNHDYIGEPVSHTIRMRILCFGVDGTKLQCLR